MFVHHKYIVLASLIFSLAIPYTVLAGGGCGSYDKAKAGDIVETAVSNGNFETLAAALKAAGLVEALQGDGPFTVFAPTDEAFAKLPEGTLDALLKDIPKLKSILLYHVVSGEVPSQEAAKLDSAGTLQGSEVTIQASAGGVKVDQANVVQTDIRCSNGIIHVIDEVILPQA